MIEEQGDQDGELIGNIDALDIRRRIDVYKRQEDTPGVTRDRIYAEAEWNSVHFALIDTGGIEPSSADVILSQTVSYTHLDVYKRQAQGSAPKQTF